MQELTKIALLRNSKNLPNYFNKARSNGINNFMPKRNFNSNIDKILGNLLNKLPRGDIGLAIVFLNSFFYFLYLIWPAHNMYSFINNFTFSKYNLSQGYLQTFFTCHFTHMSFFSYLIDTVILYLFCQNTSMMYGPLFVAKTILLSMFLGSVFLFAHHTGG